LPFLTAGLSGAVGILIQAILFMLPPLPPPPRAKTFPALITIIAANIVPMSFFIGSSPFFELTVYSCRNPFPGFRRHIPRPACHSSWFMLLLFF